MTQPAVSAKPQTAGANVWSIVGLVTIAMIIAYVDRANLSAALASKEFISAFGLNDTQRGLLNSAFFWSYALLQIPAGYFVDRYGVKYPLAFGYLFWGIISAATALATGFWHLFAIRLLLGVGEAVLVPASLRWMRFNIDEKQRGLALGIFFAGAKVGPAIGIHLSTVLMQDYGWRAMFAILGVGGLLWLIPWMLMARNDDRERERISQAAAKASGAQQLQGSTIVLAGILVGTFCYNYFLYFSLTWLPAYFVERRGLNLKDMSTFSAMSFLGTAITATLAGFVADRMISRGGDPVKVRKGFILLGLILASTEVIGAYAQSTDVALFFAVFSLAGLGLTTANYWALTQTLMPGAAIGRIAGLQNTASNLSGIAAPILTGWLKQETGSYEAPMLLLCGFLLLGLASYTFLVRREYAIGKPA